MQTAKIKVLDWLHTRAELGLPFHYTKICDDLGLGTSSVSNALYTFQQDSKIPVTKLREKGMWQFGPFDRLPAYPPLQRSERVISHAADQYNRIPKPAHPEVIGFTPQGNLVTRDRGEGDSTPGVIRIWTPAEHTLAT